MEIEIKVGCGSKSNEKKSKNQKETSKTIKTEEDVQMIRVGRPAPLFEAEAYKDGKFVNVNLEDYRGKWVLLCFYPGDFTFV